MKLKKSDLNKIADEIISELKERLNARADTLNLKSTKQAIIEILKENLNKPFQAKPYFEINKPQENGKHN